MKKLLVTLVCATVLTSLVACKTEPTTVPSNVNSPENSDVTSASETPSNETTTELTLDVTTITPVGTKEVVLIDTDEYKLTLKENRAPEINADDTDGFFWFEMHLENKTDEKLAFFYEDIEINGIKIPTEEKSWSYRTNADPADTSYASLNLTYELLLSSGITTIEEVSFVLDAYSLVGVYEDLGDLKYTSERLSFTCIPNYDGSDEEDEEDTPANTYTSNEVTIEEQVLWDDDKIKICTTGEFTFEENYGHSIGLTIQNKTDTELMIKSEYAQVNGYSLSTPLWVSVPANQTIDAKKDILFSDLLVANIDTISRIEFVLSVGNVNKYLTDPIVIETSASGYDQPNEFEGSAVYNDNGIEILALDCVYDLQHLSGPVLYVHNECGTEINLYLDNITINGTPVGSSMILCLYNNQYHVKIIDLGYQMNENDIETINEITFDLTIINSSFDTIAENIPVSVSY